MSLSVRVLTALALLVGPTLAGEGRIPIWESTVITENGRYVVTRNLSAPAGGGIVIEITLPATDVDIDLNGFTVSGDAGGADVVRAVSVQNVALRNGSISGTGRGFDMSFGTGRTIVENVTFSGPLSQGISLLANGTEATFEILGNRVETTGTIGIQIAGTPKHGLIAGNSVIVPLASPIAVTVVTQNINSLAIRNNRLSGGGVAALEVQNAGSCSIDSNEIRGAGAGISVLQSRCRITDNVVSGSTRDGIVLAASTSFNVLRGNLLVSNGRDGIRIEGTDNTLEGNVTKNNTGFGLFLSGNNNVLVENDSGNNSGVCGGSGLACGCNLADVCIDVGVLGTTTAGDNVCGLTPGC